MPTPRPEQPRQREATSPTGSDLQRLVDLAEAWTEEPAPESFIQASREAGADAGELSKLDAWLAQQPLGEPSPGHRLDARLRWLKALTGLFGLLLGAGFMAGLVAYDGSRQVSVLWLLGFAGLQLLLSALALIYLLRGGERLPLLSELVSHLPARLYQGPLRRLMDARNTRDGFASLHVPFLLWLSQRFALTFSVAALVMLVLYVIFQDIAFGWSTTLQLSPASFHTFTHWLALPWSWLWPAAAPSLELVQTSQFYRMGDVITDDPAQLGRWWPFLVMTWLVYAVLPRYLLLRLSRRRWGQACCQALRAHPDYGRTLGRLYFDHAAARREAAAVISQMLVDMLGHVEISDTDRGDLKTTRRELEQRWRDWLAQREQQAFVELARIYLQQTTLAAAAIEIPDSDTLFAIKDWEKWGLSRRQIALIAGATGAAIGGGVDAATGFTTLGSAAAIGGIGGFASVYLSDRVAEISSDSMEIRFGPARHRQFPFALLGRTLSVWRQLAGNVPGDQHRPSIRNDWQAVLGQKQQRLLHRAFVQVGKSRSYEARAEIEKSLVKLMEDLQTTSE